jgi:hypothetical protein
VMWLVSFNSHWQSMVMIKPVTLHIIRKPKKSWKRYKRKYLKILMHDY